MENLIEFKIGSFYKVRIDVLAKDGSGLVIVGKALDQSPECVQLEMKDGYKMTILKKFLIMFEEINENR